MAERKQRRIEASVVKTINLGNYESVKLGAKMSTVIADKADLSKAFALLWDECNDQVDSQIDGYDSEIEESEETPTDSEIEEPEKEEEAKEEAEEEEADITEEQINAMSKKELTAFCEETEGLEDIDTKKGVKVLRVLVIDALFEEEEEETGKKTEDDDKNEDGDDEWGDDDWED